MRDSTILYIQTTHTHCSVVGYILLPFPQEEVNDGMPPITDFNHLFFNYFRTARILPQNKKIGITAILSMML